MVDEFLHQGDGRFFGRFHCAVGVVVLVGVSALLCPFNCSTFMRQVAVVSSQPIASVFTFHTSGLAASMASFLLAAGEPGRRLALPHSRVGGALGNANGQMSR